MLILGVDPGVRTGLAAWDIYLQKLVLCETTDIVRAMLRVQAHSNVLQLVVIEDARKRKWFGATDAAQAEHGAGVREGIGSVKRDCSIWQEFCEYYELPFEMRAPQAGSTKWSPRQFKAATHWEGTSSEHSRDAALLVVGSQ